jgi:nucleotide-binding universal stress UspA family protein
MKVLNAYDGSPLISIRLLMVLDPSILSAMNNFSPSDGDSSASTGEGAEGGIKKMLDSHLAIVRQSTSDICVSTMLIAGEPKHVLVEESEGWGADCIFIGSRGLNRWERLWLGSVSTAVAARARCPVEVLRALRPLS